MIQSMTGFGSAQAANETGVVNVEIKSVNSRYLDLSFRLPDELRLAEMPLRELVGRCVSRGKVDVRASFTRAQKDITHVLSPALLSQVQAAYQHVQQTLPTVAPPTFADVLQWSDTDKTLTDPTLWVPLCQQAAKQALEQLSVTRAREGARLAEIIDEQATQAKSIIEELKSDLPELLKTQSARITVRMREAFDQAVPQGLAHISAAEISERLHAEASIFSLRADVAEELVRLDLHITELKQTLSQSQFRGSPTASKPSHSKVKTAGIGKRLDFLFQEMNREANTLGSKAVDIRLTRAAVDLKLLIEQMREQIQNIE